MARMGRIVVSLRWSMRGAGTRVRRKWKVVARIVEGYEAGSENGSTVRG